MAAKIALIDDSRLALQWAVEKLTASGYEVVTHAQSLGIQVFVRRAKPDMVLLDVNMPALNGDTVCRMLKQHSETSSIAVALYSSMPEDQLATLAAECGADGFVCKTEDVTALVKQIENILRRRRGSVKGG